MIEKIINLIFPPVCGICGKIDKNYLCDECEKKINKMKAHKILDNIKYCEKGMSIFKYEDIIRENIINYKFNNKSYLYKTFEKIIINDKKVCDFIKNYDIIIPVPIHRKRKFERGYNQCELIISNFVKEWNLNNCKKIILDKQSLIKIKNNNKQSLLSKEGRKNNVKNVYLLDNQYSKYLKDKKVLIFDDILTTGSTIEECSKILKMAKPIQIGALTFAKD